ncbi:hypothetical protein BpHYR1_019887 [Brachionus plicatilis]|uniref:Uncharacterized protein n=1 Tax=Brachionus plicatilis TaxID=10195 RepID=A0A3M7T9C4_BRAPC|nr:hypothetical protein BpHYR1_019887 [Brachionus plicatilis]
MIIIVRFWCVGCIHVIGLWFEFDLLSPVSTNSSCRFASVRQIALLLVLDINCSNSFALIL